MGDVLGNAAERTAQQQKALLDAVAQAGTAGAAAYQQAQTATNDIRQRAVGSALGAAATSPLSTQPGGTQAIVQPIQNNLDLRSADLAQGQATFGQDIARQQVSGNEYFGRLGAALPIVESRTQQAIQKILSDERQAQEQRNLQLETSRNALAASRASSSGNSLRDQLAQNAENRTQFCFDNPDDPKCLSVAERKQNAIDDANARSTSIHDALNSTLAAETPRVAKIIADAFGSTVPNPIAYLQSLIGSQLETRATADKGGIGKGHQSGLLNYEYILDKVNQILAAGNTPAASAGPATAVGSGGQGD